MHVSVNIIIVKAIIQNNIKSLQLYKCSTEILMKVNLTFRLKTKKKKRCLCGRNRLPSCHSKIIIIILYIFTWNAIKVSKYQNFNAHHAHKLSLLDVRLEFKPLVSLTERVNRQCMPFD